MNRRPPTSRPPFSSDDTPKKIRVLVVDDSSFMRQTIKKILSADPGIEVISTARDGQDGFEKATRLAPDVVTMDIEMPRLDGLGALKRIMATSPLPVIMVSSLTTEGAEATLLALELGAVDFIPKDMGRAGLDVANIGADLVAKVKAVAGRRVRSFLDRGHDRRPMPRRLVGKVRRGRVAVVAVGASTGGPPALQKMISPLPADFPAPMIVVQHMPPAFTGPFAQRLDGASAVTVREAGHGELLEPGKVYIAPGGKHLTLDTDGQRVRTVLSDEPADTIHRPSADVMMNSAAQIYQNRSLGVILTGMGHDGQDGMAAIKAAKGITLAQDEESCVVYGMPRAVIESGLADDVISIDDMWHAVLDVVAGSPAGPDT